MHYTPSTIRRISTFRPDLSSVLSEQEEGQYLFVIIDRKKVLLLFFSNGNLEMSRQIIDPSVLKSTRIDSGELHGRNNKRSHKIDNQVQRHLQLLMQGTRDFVQGRDINGVFIGGHKPLHHLIKRALPADLQNKLRGDFITELNIPEADIIKHCIHILDEYKQ